MSTLLANPRRNSTVDFAQDLIRPGRPDLSKTMTIHLYGGPGCGKSTMAAGIFNGLKRQGVNAELVTEFAKDLVWERNGVALSDQFYVSAVQQHREFVLRNQVDVIISDSPPMLGVIYNRDPDQERSKALEHWLVLDEHSRTGRTLNLLLNRSVTYQQDGRNEDQEKARALDRSIAGLLDRHEIPYRRVDVDQQESVVKAVAQGLNHRMLN